MRRFLFDDFAVYEIRRRASHVGTVPYYCGVLRCPIAEAAVGQGAQHWFVCKCQNPASPRWLEGECKDVRTRIQSAEAARPGKAVPSRSKEIG